MMLYIYESETMQRILTFPIDAIPPFLCSILKYHLDMDEHAYTRKDREESS